MEETVISNRLIRMSKFASFVLRHKPQNFGLSPDPYGFVEIADLLEVLKNRYRDIKAFDLEQLVQNCPKKRFEIKGSKIRARYGHSFDVVLDITPCEPPDYLYHGTSPALINTILGEGLLPTQRRYVHLSKTKEDAFQVGKRKSQNPILFIVKAREAYQDGMKFYDMGEVMLTEYIPAEYLSLGEYWEQSDNAKKERG